MLITYLMKNIFNYRLKMQVESGMTKWAGRVPPLDLSSVSVCPRETEHRWRSTIHPSPKKHHHQQYDQKIGADGLPIGESLCSLLFIFK